MKRPTLAEFMAGTPIEYPAAKGKRKTCEATLVSETSVAVTDEKGVVSFAEIPEGTARNLYHNLTRSKPDA